MIWFKLILFHNFYITKVLTLNIIKTKGLNESKKMLIWFFPLADCKDCLYNTVDLSKHFDEWNDCLKLSKILKTKKKKTKKNKKKKTT